jgi:uncharacterized alkaline shock family protein YloU
MEDKYDIKGLTLADGVVETLVAAAVAQVEGVAQVGAPHVTTSLLQIFTKKRSVPGVLIYEDSGSFVVDVHLQVIYGARITEVAAAVREAVVGALDSQVGIKVGTVNVFVDGIQFAK